MRSPHPSHAAPTMTQSAHYVLPCHLRRNAQPVSDFTVGELLRESQDHGRLAFRAELLEDGLKPCAALRRVQLTLEVRRHAEPFLGRDRLDIQISTTPLVENPLLLDEVVRDRKEVKD